MLIFYLCSNLLVIHLKIQATVKSLIWIGVSHILHLIAHVGNDSIYLEHQGFGGGYCRLDIMRVSALLEATCSAAQGSLEFLFQRTTEFRCLCGYSECCDFCFNDCFLFYLTRNPDVTHGLYQLMLNFKTWITNLYIPQPRFLLWVTYSQKKHCINAEERDVYGSFILNFLRINFGILSK